MPHQQTLGESRTEETVKRDRVPGLRDTVTAKANVTDRLCGIPFPSHGWAP